MNQSTCWHSLMVPNFMNPQLLDHHGTTWGLLFPPVPIPYSVENDLLASFHRGACWKDPFRTSRASSTSSTSALRHALEKVSHFNKVGTETKTYPMSTKPFSEIQSIQSIELQQWKSCCIVLSLFNCKHFFRCMLADLYFNQWEHPHESDPWWQAS